MSGFAPLRWQKAAFGLIGLLVVIAIIGVLLVFVCPDNNTNSGEQSIRSFLAVLLFSMLVGLAIADLSLVKICEKPGATLTPR